MLKFEAYIAERGEMGVTLIDSGERFLLDSDRGYDFAYILLENMGIRYPTMIKAVEQKIKFENRSLYSVMKANRRVYVTHIVHQICSCCFGEIDENPDYDGKKYNFEYPRQCRCLKHCPWNGYSERNKDSFMVICGAKREWGFSSQQRRVALMVQSGVTDYNVMASVMQLSKDSIHKFMLKIHEKMGVSKLPDMINLLMNERI